MVVGEVSKAVSTALDEFHFTVEALCDAVIFGKTPHAGDGLCPGAKGVSQCDERLEAAGCEPVNEAQELVSKGEALAFSSVLLVEEIAQAVHFGVKRLQSGVGGKKARKAQVLGRSQFMRGFAEHG